jgi:hypothetical protein
MAALDYRITFVYLEPEPTGSGAKLISSEISIAAERGHEDWDSAGVQAFARSLAKEMKGLGDEGPFRWRLAPMSGSSRLWTFEVKGKSTLTAPSFPLRDEQLPADPTSPKSIG